MKHLYTWVIVFVAAIFLLSMPAQTTIQAATFPDDPVPVGTLLFLPGVQVAPPTPTASPTPTNTPIPPANKIVYLCGGSGATSNICIMNADGTRPKRIAAASSTAYYSQPRLSPDGRRVVFSKITTGGAQGTQWAIGTMNADGSNYKEYFGGTDTYVSPEWSPDGSKLAFVSTRDSADNNNVFIVSADGSGSPTKITDTSDMIYRDLSWSHDGQRIMFGGMKLSVSTEYRIWYMNSDGTGQIQLTFSGGRADKSPRWSHDGTRIVFERAFGPGQTFRQVFVMNQDGTNQIQVTDGREHYYPGWSPNGDKIICNIGSGLAVMNSDGTNQVNLTNPDDNALEIWADWR